VAVGPPVFVAVGDGPSVTVFVAVGVEVVVGVEVAVFVAVGVEVAVFVAVGVEVAVFVAVAVGVEVTVGVGVLVGAASTLVVTVELLSAGWGSGVSLVTVAVFVIVVPAAAAVGCTTVVMVIWSPLAIVPSEQLMVPVLPTGGRVHVTPDGAVSDWNVTLAGRVSATLALTAASGPSLVITHS
jgi:hypothetical protein